MPNTGYRGEVRPRRQPTRHHISMYSGAHQKHTVEDPFPPISTKQFPALYVRSPVTNQYRRYMRIKSPYVKARRG